MTQSDVVVSRNGQVHHRDEATAKAVGPLLGWVERDPENHRHWIAQSIAGGRIATEKTTRSAALRTLLQHIRTVQTPVLAATVDTGPIDVLNNSADLRRWGNVVGAWIGGIAGTITVGLFIYAITLS